MSIQEWPVDERPRERLLKHGAHSLTDAELLAIFLRVGVRGKSAVDLARELLSTFGSLQQLVSAPRTSFTAIQGMGDAKYCQLQAVLELAKRALLSSLKETIVLNTPHKVTQYLATLFANQTTESFVGLFLDSQNRLIEYKVLSQGSVTQSFVYPRTVIKLALELNATGLIVAHNHPYGVSTPSQADKALTSELKTLLSSIEVRLLDHIIIASRSPTQAPTDTSKMANTYALPNCFSFVEHGLL